MLAPRRSVNTTGILCAIAAYSFWGLFPIYWSFLKVVPPLEILSHRIVWSFVFYIALLFLIKKSNTPTVLKSGLSKVVRVIGCAIMISANWLLYVWAVNNGHVMESSLGYFINPLVSIALGFIFLKERLNKPQTVALLLALAGVLYLTLHSATGFPWIAMGLATTFGFYGLFRKTLGLETLVGSTLETLLLVPLGLIVLLGVKGVYEPQFGILSLSSLELKFALLLVAGGAVTGIPLLLFSEASTRLPLSTLGFFQYIAPSIQFLCAVFFFGETFTSIHAISYSLIWIGIIINLISMAQKSKLKN